MSLPHLSLTDARHLHLAAQGLLKKTRRRATPADILATISRMSLLQIDTINIVARSPYLVLFSRLGDYSPQWLDDSLQQGARGLLFAAQRFYADTSPHAGPGEYGLEV